MKPLPKFKLSLSPMSQDGNWIIANGQLHDGVPAGFFEENRAFRLGDGFFESMKVAGGRVQSFRAHHSRIATCCKAMQMKLPASLSIEILKKSLSQLIAKNSIRSGRLRLTIFRSGAGTYKPETNQAAYLAEIKPLQDLQFTINDRGLIVGLYKAMQKVPDRFSPFKMLGNQIYIQAAIWAQQQNFDDALILNPEGRVIEASASNIFLVRNAELHTPPLSEGCVGGIMRMKVMNAAIDMGMDVFQTQIDEHDILEAQEVFLSNAVKGIQWVGGFGYKRYFHKMSDRLIEKINELSREEVNEIG